MWYSHVGCQLPQLSSVGCLLPQSPLVGTCSHWSDVVSQQPSLVRCCCHIVAMGRMLLPHQCGIITYRLYIIVTCCHWSVGHCCNQCESCTCLFSGMTPAAGATPMTQRNSTVAWCLLRRFGRFSGNLDDQIGIVNQKGILLGWSKFALYWSMICIAVKVCIILVKSCMTLRATLLMCGLERRSERR